MGNFLMGFGMGLSIGMLFAPKSGSETRRVIAEKASQSSDYLMQHSQDLKDSATDLLERGRSMVMNQKDRLSDAVDSMSSNVSSSMPHSYSHQG